MGMLNEFKQVYYVCTKCDSQISDICLCTYECENDGLLINEREYGSVIKKTYSVTLFNEEIYSQCSGK